MPSAKIPEDIRQFRPGPCTEIKLINGRYYVYMYQARKLPSGRWGKKTGKSIGTIIPGKGFVPNKNYHLYVGKQSLDEITVLEYGQYALIGEIAKDIFSSLQRHFTPDCAAQIFTYARILYANGFVHLDQIHAHYEQSWLSQEYKDFSLHMGKTALGSLLDALGRRTKRVVQYEQDCIQESSAAMAIDGHAIRCCSDKNDLGESGYKFRQLNEDQVNLLMGYDINSGTPLFARMYRGSCNDKTTIQDLDELFAFTGILFVIDRGFYSKKNLSIFSANKNSYIISVPGSMDVFKTSMEGLRYTDSFYYRSGKKHARIEYTSKKISDTEHVYVFRDIEENEKSRFNYQRCIEYGKEGYTWEKFEQIKESFGVYVLQSNATLSAEEVFSRYKKRWGIETLYQYLKNNADFNDLMIQDYYKEQGFAFIMLIVGQIHQKMKAAVKSLNNSTFSVTDILLMAKCLKMEKRGSQWILKNARKRDLQILELLGFKPKLIVSEE